MDLKYRMMHIHIMLVTGSIAIIGLIQKAYCNRTTQLVIKLVILLPKACMGSACSFSALK